MKKEKTKKITSLFAYSIIIILLCSSFVLADIIKPNKKNYKTGESVYVLSTISASDSLCRSVAEEEVKLYIVAGKESWSGGEAIEDVREEASLVPNSKFSNKKVWEDVDSGNYDLIIDCDDNKKYDLGEPIYDSGFNVSQKKGTGRAFNGDEVIKDFSWFFDPEEPNLVNEILQIRLSAENENIGLVNITIEFNTPKDGLSIENLEIYADKNNNAALDPVDVKIGESKPEGIIKNQDKVDMLLDYVLNKGIDENFLVVLNMKKDVLKGEYSLKVISLHGKGDLSEEDIVFFGFPKESNGLKVLDPKSCLGSMILNLNPNPVDEKKEVVAKITGLDGCDNKKVSLRANPCYDPVKKEIGFCVLEDNSCEITFTSVDNQKYYACVDKNGDKDLVDFGESISVDLVVNRTIKGGVIEEVLEEEVSSDERIEESVVEEESDKSVGGITGSVVGRGSLAESDAFLVLLEVTLLLILFVLVLILFKLRSPVSVGEDNLIKEGDENKERVESILENKGEEIKEIDFSDEKKS